MPSLTQYATMVGTHTAVFTEPARNVPTNKMVDGPLLGNGDVGVVMAGPPEAVRFHIGKNDFWGVRTQAPMTVGQVQILTPVMQGASYRAEQDMEKAEVRATFVKGAAILATRAWVDATANRFFIELANAGDTALSLGVAIIKGAQAESMPVSATNSAVAGFLYAPDTKSGARKLALYTRLLGCTLEGTTSTLAPGEQALVATVIISDLDAKDPLTEAKAQIYSMTLEKSGEMLSHHREWWRKYWSRSFIEIPDKVIEQRWYAAQYVMGSCSREGKVAPGLWGNWITMDKPAWHGDYHLNYNFQAPFYGLYSGNRTETTRPFYEAMNQSIPRGRRIAAEHGWSGIHLPVSIGPWGMCPEGDDCDWGQRSNTAYAALLYIWHWLYTLDLDWLKTTGYTFLRETAAFWEDYLTFENGRYLIYRDAIHEGSGDDMNSLLSLGLVRTLFRHMVPMSEALGVDADKREKWNDICDRISAFPTQERDGKTVFRYSEQGMSWCDDNTLGIQHIFPAGAITLESYQDLIEISRTMIDAMHRWHDYNGFSSWYTACARVGYDPTTILAKLRTECDNCSLPNLVLSYGGGGIENCAGFLAVNEMMLQSHVGNGETKEGIAGRHTAFVIRIFPCWPKDQDARFGTLRAVGAFLVSAEMKSGEVTGVTIISEKGRECTVINPWPGRTAHLVRNVTGAPCVTETKQGERFTFATTVNEMIELNRQCGDQAGIKSPI